MIARAVPPYALATLLPLALAPGVLDASTYPKLAGACVLIALGLLAAQPASRHSGAFRNPVLAALLAFVVIQSFALTQSPRLEEGLWTLLLRALPMAVALLVFRFAGGFADAMRDLSRAVVTGSLLQSLIGGLQYFGLAFESLPGSGFLPQGTLANKNILAAWLAMCLPLAAFALLDARKAWRWAARAAVAAAVFLIVVGYSRTAWILLASFLGMGMMAWFRLRGTEEISKAIRMGLVIGAAAAALAVLCDSVHTPAHLTYRGHPGFGDFSNRLASIADLRDIRNSERLELWRPTLTMISERPLLGSGPGSWKLAYPRYGGASVNPDPERFPASPHNDYLLVASESGIPGLLTYLLVFGAAICILAAAWRGGGSQSRFAAICLLASLGAYMVDAGFNFPGDRVEPTVLLGLLLGTAALGWVARANDSAHGIRPVGAFGWRERAPDAAVTALALGGLVFCLLRWDAEAHLRKGLLARDRGEGREAAGELAAADRPWYRMDRPGTPIAFYRGMAELKAGEREQALALLERAHGVNPTHIHVLNGLGSLNVSFGRFDSGIRWYEKCLALRPDFQEARVNLAATLFNKGRWRMAKATLDAIPAEARSPLAIAYGRRVDELLEEKPGHD